MRFMTSLAMLIALAAPTAASADGRIIVKYRKSASAGKRRSSVQAIGGALVGVVRGQGTRLIAVTGDPAAAAARLTRSPGVQWAEPDYELAALDVPDDPLLAQ